MIGKVGPVGKLKCCYEAGPTGYVLYWQLTQMGVACEVSSPGRRPSPAPVMAAIDEAVQQASPEIRAVIEALQALRGVAQTTALARELLGFMSAIARHAEAPPRKAA